MSCDEAIIYLAQVQEAARTGNDEVAELTLGFGQGLSKRVRACHSVDQKLVELRASLQKASADNKEAKSQRAKALWHLALEMVTMGELPQRCVGRVKSKFRSLWFWRSLVSAHPKASQSHKQLPVFLQRGWRPSSSLLGSWHRTHPEFFWSHSNSYFLESIPVEADPEEVALAVALSLVHSGFCDSVEAALQRFQLIEMEKASSTRNAGLLFNSKEEAAAVLKKAAQSNGIIVVSASTIPLVEDHIAANKAEYDEAKAAYLVRSQTLRSVDGTCIYTDEYSHLFFRALSNADPPDRYQ